MKFLRLLAIFTSLALNCEAQWHTNEPFAAWPAANHLRWVDDVGVYTNFPNWQTNGYGLWTNNLLVASNFFTGFDEYNYIDVLYPFPFDGSPTPTNMMLNAKDARSIDCTYALLERALAIGKTTNDFVHEFTYDYYSLPFKYWLYRDERANIADFKKYILTKLVGQYYLVTWSNGLPDLAVTTESNLCAVSDVPTNFLTYTPSRAADVSFTVSNNYTHILTNTFTLRQGTNATHWATNNLVDSAGISFVALGSNGMIITRYATNEHIQAGRNITDYGYDGLKRVISNLYATAYTATWTNNGTLNKLYGYGEGETNMFPFPMPDPWPPWSNLVAQSQQAASDSLTNEAASLDVPQEYTSYHLFDRFPSNYVYVSSSDHTIVRQWMKADSIPTNSARTVYFFAKVGLNGSAPFGTEYTNYNTTATRDAWVSLGTNSASTLQSVSPDSLPASINPPLTPWQEFSDTSWPPNLALYLKHRGWEATDKKALAFWDFRYK